LGGGHEDVGSVVGVTLDQIGGKARIGHKAPVGRERRIEADRIPPFAGGADRDALGGAGLTVKDEDVGSVVGVALD
jgi:hypothetical protein